MTYDRFNNRMPHWLSDQFFRLTELDHYARISRELLVTPTPQMLEFCDGGQEIVSRYNTDKTLWRLFRQKVTERHPDLPAWQQEVCINGHKISSMVELAVYRRLLLEASDTLNLRIQPFIRELDYKGQADFSLFCKGHPTLYIEVAGTVTSQGKSVSKAAESFRPGIEERLFRYVGVAPVEVIHVDEVCHVKVQTERVRHIIARARSV
ncbi:hypothetical protein AD948_00620 [Acetobacter senegalensis]|uniref:DUF559 domain-containing protein n=1 Tax=Acetobacter senegalensis TaxID=446692 RepID=A0A149U8H8_9PROT|nr:hypothetical protein [Acetobacter senegalensis]KXV61744.1 hypothetical protein AD948_00620 [Acetobacter senegalensis]